MMIRLPLKCECPCCMSSYVKLNKDFCPFWFWWKGVFCPLLCESYLLFSSTGCWSIPLFWQVWPCHPSLTTHWLNNQHIWHKCNELLNCKKREKSCLYHCPHEFKRYVQYETHISVTCIAWWNALFLHNLMHFTLLQITFHCIVSKQIVGALWSCQSGELGGCNRPKWTQDHHHVTL